MDIAFDTVNWAAVFVAGVANMIVGGIWYSPFVAGKAWMAEMGYSAKDMEGKSPKEAMIKSFIGALILALGLAIILGMPAFSAAGWLKGAEVGFFLAVIITGAGTYCNYAFESKSTRHFIIHLGNHAVAMVVMGAIIAAWR